VTRSASSPRAPALACWILESVLPSAAAASPNALVGDLVEEYALRAASDSFDAACWIWSQTLRSLPSLVLSAARNDWLMNARVAAFVYVVMVGAKLAISTLISHHWAMRPLAVVLVAPAVFIVVNAAGGLVVARLRRTAAVQLIAMVMLTVIVLSIEGTCPIAVPWWYPCGFFAVAPLSILLPPAFFASANVARCQ
jgi:hypothetical protein